MLTGRNVFFFIEKYEQCLAAFQQSNRNNYDNNSYNTTDSNSNNNKNVDNYND